MTQTAIIDVKRIQGGKAPLPADKTNPNIGHETPLFRVYRDNTPVYEVQIEGRDTVQANFTAVQAYVKSQFGVELNRIGHRTMADRTETWSSQEFNLAAKRLGKKGFALAAATEIAPKAPAAAAPAPAQAAPKVVDPLKTVTQVDGKGKKVESGKATAQKS